MRVPDFLSHTSARTRILLGIAGVFLLAALLFDSNWLRQPLERYLTEKSGRAVSIEHLNVHLGLDLSPHVTLRGVNIENAKWAAPRPMAVIGEASFSFSLLSTLRGVTIVPLLILSDADIDMEKQADGLRNWRITHPDDRGPAKVKVHLLEAHRSRIRFVDRGRDLDMMASASDLPAERTAAIAKQAGDPAARFTSTVDFSGTYRGARFSGRALTGPALSFLDSGEYFPVRGSAVSREVRLEVDGRIADLLELGAVDANLRIAAPSLAALKPFAPGTLPASHPFDFTLHLVKRDDEYDATNVKGRLGASDLAGAFSVSAKAEPNKVRAKLRSASANLADFTSITAHEEAPATDAPAGGASSHPGKFFPATNLHAERWKTLDAEFDFDARKFSAPESAAVESLRFTGIMRNGALSLKALRIGVAGGEAVGTFALDGRTSPLTGDVALQVRGVRLERLFTRLADLAAPGPLAGRIRFTGRGDSIAAIMGHATGDVAGLLEGGSISNKLDAKIGLDLGKFVSLYFRGDRDVPVNCAALMFTFKDGAGTARLLRLDTEQTRVEGSGAVTLGDEKFDLRFRPQPKQPGLLALHSVIRVEGDLVRPSIKLDKRGEFVPAAAPGGDTARTIEALLRSSARCSAALDHSAVAPEVTAQR